MNFASLKKFTGILMLLSLAFTAVLAQKKTTLTDTTFLNEIVVTSTRSAARLGNTGVPVKLISDTYIKKTGSLKLQDILQEHTGIILVNSTLSTSLSGYPNPFGQGIQMLGMDPAYSAILLDGEPLVGRNAGILKLGRIATGNIKQVEIVKGPSSCLYGSEAMAGVINIITTRPQRELLEAQIQAGSNNTFAQTLSYSRKIDKTGIQVFMNRYTTGGYDLDAKTYGKTIDPYRDYTLQLKVNHRFSPKTELLATVRNYDSKQKNDYLISWQNDIANVNGYTNESDRSLFAQLTHQFDRKKTLYLRTFADRYQNKAFVQLKGTDLRFDETSFDQSIIKPEIQYEVMNERHKYVAGGGMYLETIDASRYAGRQDIQTLYGFTQTEWYLFQKKLTLIGGVRADKRTDYDVNWSPRLALAYQPTASWKLTASAGFGFKAPDFRHMYLSFSNAQIGYSLIGANVLGNEITSMQEQGELETGSDITPLLKNKKLLPETSKGMHLGLRYHRGRWHVESGIFRNDINNLIDVYLLPVQKIGNKSLFSYHNINRIFTQGIETDISYILSKTITLTAGYQYLEAKDKDVLEKIRAGKLFRRDPVTFSTSQVRENEYFGLNNRSRHQFNSKISWNHEKSGWGVFLRCVYRGAYGFEDINGNGIADDERELVKGFMMMNMTVSKTIRQNWSIQAGVENMLNHTNVMQMPNLAGRIYFININYSIHQLFNKNKSTT